MNEQFCYQKKDSCLSQKLSYRRKFFTRLYLWLLSFSGVFGFLCILSIIGIIMGYTQHWWSLAACFSMSAVTYYYSQKSFRKA